MTTDIRYAMGQVERAQRCLRNGEVPPTSRISGGLDSIQRAIDALERCLEAAPAYEAAYDAGLDLEADVYPPLEVPFVD